jgi:hypothetical protein
VLSVIAAAAVCGCAGGRAVRVGSAASLSPADAVRRALDRWERWGSLSARVTFTVTTGDTTFKARGHLFYLLGERYEIGFVRPFDRILGTLYVTPERMIHWGSAGKPKSFGAADTVSLAELVPMTLPNWDPRDVLPLPVSGRVGGFQLDSAWTADGLSHVAGTAVGAAHVLTIGGTTNDVVGETVRRVGREPVIKTYARIRSLDGWPIATRVACSDTSGTFKLTWTLKGLLLDAAEPSPPSSAPASHSTETEP